METFNVIVTGIFTSLLSPFDGLAAIYGLLLISILSGVALAYIYGLISNQGALKRVKKRISAGIYESVIFRHDLLLSLKAQLGMFLGGLRYFMLAVPPLFILLIPSLVILAQLNLRYGVRPLRVGESAIITAKLNSDEPLFSTELVARDSGIKITPPLRDLDSNSVSWRVDVLETNNENRHPIDLVVNGISSPKEIFSGKQPIMLPSEIHSSPWWQFLYPGATVNPEIKSVLNSVSITYPEQAQHLAGIELHWLAVFAIVSIASGLVASKLIGIEI